MVVSLCRPPRSSYLGCGFSTAFSLQKESFSRVPCPPIEVHPIEDASTTPSSLAPVPVPPPAPLSPLPVSDAENILLACCANPPATSAPLVPIEEVASDAEDSNGVTERLDDHIGNEDALHFLNGSNQSQGAHHRAVCAIAHCPAPYHCMQAGECRPQ